MLDIIDRKKRAFKKGEVDFLNFLCRFLGSALAERQKARALTSQSRGAGGSGLTGRLMAVSFLKAGTSGRRLFPAEKLVILSVSFFSLLILIDYLVGGNREIYLVPVSLAINLLFFLFK